MMYCYPYAPPPWTPPTVFPVYPAYCGMEAAPPPATPHDSPPVVPAQQVHSVPYQPQYGFGYYAPPGSPYYQPYYQPYLYPSSSPPAPAAQSHQTRPVRPSPPSRPHPDHPPPHSHDDGAIVAISRIPTAPAHLGPTWVTSCDDIIALLGVCDGTLARPDPRSRAAFWRRAFLDGAWTPEHDCLRPGRLPPRGLVDCASPLGFVNRDIPPGRRQARANRAAAAAANASKKAGAAEDENDANTCPDSKTQDKQKQPQQQQRQCRRKGATAYLKPNVSESRPLTFAWRDHRGADIRPEHVTTAYGHTWETACDAAARRYDGYERARVGGYNERLAAYYARGRLNLLVRALRCSGQQRLPERPPDEDLTLLWRVVTCDRALKAGDEKGEGDGEDKREEEGGGEKKGEAESTGKGKGKGKKKGKGKQRGETGVKEKREVGEETRDEECGPRGQ